MSTVNVSLIVLLCFCLLHVNAISEVEQNSDDPVEAHRIAIIGGGIGGTAAAYFLQELTSGRSLIDVYESGHIGGRLATIPFAKHYYEIGGSIIHPDNEYMKKFIDEFGLARNKQCPASSGLFDGSKFVFRDSSWSLVEIFRLLMRYGLDVYKLRNSNNNLIRWFKNIYTIQDHGLAFKNTSSLLYAIYPSFPSMLRQTSRQYFEKKIGTSSLIVDELVTAAMLTNYGQTPDVQSFVGSIAVAGASPSLYSVRGGNKQVPEMLLTKSRASVLRRHVTQITAVPPESNSNISGKEGRTTFQVSSVEVDGNKGNPMFKEGLKSSSSSQKNTGDEESLRTQEYDAVIIATPLTKDKSNIKFVNMSKEYTFPGQYKRIVATLVQGEIRKRIFHLSNDDDIDDIFSVNPDLVYNSIGKLTPIDAEDCDSNVPKDVFKIFSHKPLSDHELTLLFSEVKQKKSVDWLAYPRYPNHQTNEASFELQPGLYHLNAVEWASSAMELSAVGAKNVALLALKYLTGDPKFGNVYSSKRDEL